MHQVNIHMTKLLASNIQWDLRHNRYCAGRKQKMQIFFIINIIWITSTINHLGLASTTDTPNCWIRKSWKSSKPTYPPNDSFSNIAHLGIKACLCCTTGLQRAKADTGNALTGQPAPSGSPRPARASGLREAATGKGSRPAGQPAPVPT